MLDHHSIVFNVMMTRLQVTRHTDLKMGFVQVKIRYILDTLTKNIVLCVYLKYKIKLITSYTNKKN